MKPKISIIVPVYQVEQYIKNSIISICNQSLNNFEVILVDDGTKDNSIQIAENVLKKSQIAYDIIHQENQGVSVARNVGIEYSHGEWIVCVDPDDIIHKDFLKILFEPAHSQGILVSLGNYQVVGSDNLFQQPNRIFNTTIYDQKAILDLFLIRKINIVVTAMLIRKDIIYENNLWYDPEIRFEEDGHYIWRVLFSQNKLLYNETPVYNYLIRPNSSMTAPSIERMLTSYDGFLRLARVISTDYDELFAKRLMARKVLALLRVSARTMSYKEFIKLSYMVKYRSCLSDLMHFPDIRAKVLSIVLKHSLRTFYLINHYCFQ